MPVDIRSDKHMKKILAIALLLISFETAALAQRARLSPELQSADPASNVDVIDQFTQSPTAGYHQIVRNLGGVLKTSLGLQSERIILHSGGRFAKFGC